MKFYEVCSGDIVIVDYISEFTNEHIFLGEAIVIWNCPLNHQPLIVYLSDIRRGVYSPTWSIYSKFSKKVGHINLSVGLDDLTSLTMKGETT